MMGQYVVANADRGATPAAILGRPDDHAEDRR
jgi:hypothetical protein